MTERADWRTIVFGGAKLGVLTAVLVVVFALVSRATAGTVETVAQAIIILLGGAAAAFLPAMWVRPQSVDGIAWASMLGLMGSLWFAVFDIALLRPLGMYQWSWDLIGGGSRMWYLPVWWMGAATVAWLGAWIAANTRGDLLKAIAQTEGVAIVLFAILALALGPFTAAMMALAYTLALVVLVPLSAVLARPSR